MQRRKRPTTSLSILGTRCLGTLEPYMSELLKKLQEIQEIPEQEKLTGF